MKKTRRLSKSVSFPAPIGGWVRNQNIGAPDRTQPQGAYLLQNIFPTATGAELRGGSDVYATLGTGTTDVTAFLRYKNGSAEKLFATTATAIYDITLVSSPTVSPNAVISGLTSGDWSSTQFETTGGIFLVGVNGSDDMRLYDGQWWYPLGDDDLYALNYDGGTVNFVQGGTLSASGGGAATIVGVQPSTTTAGTLIISSITGTIADNAALTGSLGGSALANGVPVKIFNAIAGISTNKLSYIWAYQNRLFAVEKGTLNFYYASVDQIGGTLAKFPMAGIFSLGGSILFGAAWSLDRGAGGGLSNQCIIVSTEGEVAVFQGADPASADNWSLVGVYRIGIPLGPNAWFRAGSDVVILTSIGMIPLSQAINRDVAALSPAAVSYPIETEWNDAVSQSLGLEWNVIIWPERQMVLTALPTPSGQNPRMYAANARTGRWCEFTDWNGKCLAVFQGRLFFGSENGKVVEAYVSGLDQGAPYCGVYVPLFDTLRTPDRIKTPKMVRAVTRSNELAAVQISMQYEYRLSLPPAPSALPIEVGSTWGTAVWGLSTWGGSAEKKVQEDWQSADGHGYALAAAVQIASGSVAILATEIVRIDMTYETGDL
ncbi:MAG: hypothetical protein DI604_31765 [Delftia acidovorans]|nr:MAG: hypothetical protein DI604_31765 [Delftia acidovorans]